MACGGIVNIYYLAIYDLLFGCLIYYLVIYDLLFWRILISGEIIVDEETMVGRRCGGCEKARSIVCSFLFMNSSHRLIFSRNLTHKIDYHKQLFNEMLEMINNWLYLWDI